MLRVLPYLGGLGFILLLFFLAVLVYRYATRSDRLAPKRVLQRRVQRLEVEQAMADQFLEELVRTAQASKDMEPLLADSITSQVTAFKSAQHKRKEIS